MSGNVGKMNDPDASLFIQVSEITDTTQRGAIVDLVKDMKSAGIWSKMKAVYPFVGGTATTHKWNLKDPRDLDTAFRLAFGGGWTHSSSGALSNGTNAYAETFLNVNTVFSLHNMHMCYYSNTITENTVTKYVMGCFVTPFQTNTTAIGHYYPSSKYQYFGYMQGAGASTQGAITVSGFDDRSGFICLSRTSSTPSSLKIWHNGVIDGIASTNNSPAVKPDYTIWLGCAHNQQQPNPSAPYFPTDISFTFTGIGDGLTDAEASSLYTIVQKYQTTLGRQV
jgi:hypothetical protein